MGCNCLKGKDPNNIDLTKTEKEKINKVDTSDNNLKYTEVNTRSPLENKSFSNIDANETAFPNSKSNKKKAKVSNKNVNFDEEVINLINSVRENPINFAEILIEEIKNIQDITKDNVTKVGYKGQYILPEGETLFKDLADFFRIQPILIPLNPRVELIMEPEDPNLKIGKTAEEKKTYNKLKEENDRIRYKNIHDKYSGEFQEFFILPIISNGTVQDGLILQIANSFRSTKGKNKKANEIIMHKEIKYIGVNLSQRAKKINGFLIFAY